jgi:hypothetical protein
MPHSSGPAEEEGARPARKACVPVTTRGCFTDPLSLLCRRRIGRAAFRNDGATETVFP